jgi:predicted permease
MLRKAVHSARALLGRGAAERQMDEEMRFHLEMETARLVGRGLDPQAARTEALRGFGGVDKHKEECRDANGLGTFETLSQDVRYALRGLRRNPGYTAVALATLALGIGANVAIFSVVHGVFLQSLPYGGGEKLVRLREDAPGAGVSDVPFSPPEVADYAAQTRALSSVAEYHSMWFILLRQPEPERVQTGVVSAHFFDLVGVRPLLGRTFVKGEDAPGAAPVLVLSYEYWQRSHGGDPNVVGRSFKMNDRMHTVIGVLPPMPSYPDANDVFMPVSACPFRGNPKTVNNRAARMLTVFGRLKPGATLGGLQAELATITGRLTKMYPEAYPGAEAPSAVTAVPLRQELTERARPTFFVLLATVGLVLLLACANVANLTLARQLRRQREMAVRMALGAGRKRLARQMLTESTVLSLSGGLLGVLLAAGGLNLMISFASRFTPRASEIRIDMPVLLFALAVSIATGLAFGLVPALSARLNLVAALHEGGERSSGGVLRHRLRSALIVVQVAVSFMLLIGAGLMLRSLWKLQQVDPGFHTERVLTSRLDMNFSKYNDAEKRRAFQARLLERLKGQPGVVSAALAGSFPLNDGGPQTGFFDIEGKPLQPQDVHPQADFQAVSAGYFATIGIPLIRGRGLTDADRDGAPLAGVINQTMSNNEWPSEDPIGRRISIDQGQTWIQIVGIVGDVRQYGLDRRPTSQVYVALPQYPQLSGNVLLRTASNPMAMSRLVRDAVHSIDPDQAVDRFRTLEQVRANALASPRLTSILLVLFASLALAITSAGIAGVVAFSVGERTQEFGIRLALGADPRQVMAMVLRQAMGPVAIGLALGFGGAHLLAGVMSRLLFEIHATDPPTFLAMSLVLAGVAAGASFLPARRITSVDPMIALRTA